MKKKTVHRWLSRSEAETRKIAKTLAAGLEAGAVVALHGDLGAGKTTFVKGVAEGLGVKSRTAVSSPTYVVIHQDEGRLRIYHLDWYRLERVEGVDAALAQECFDADAVTLVEWPERGEELLPKDHWTVKITHKGPTSRSVEVTR